jgi:hypothetical protein
MPCRSCSQNGKHDLIGRDIWLPAAQAAHCPRDARINVGCKHDLYGVCKACLGDALEMVRKDVAQRRAFGKQEAEQDSVPAAELAEGSSYDVLL